jgi:anti-sigma28 factor (negative regulator of flagellin synthesis)
MRLNLDSATLQTHTVSEGVSVSRAGSQSAGSVSQTDDTVQVSGVAGALARNTVDRAARLQMLTAAVADGRYTVSSAALASAIVRHAGG